MSNGENKTKQRVYRFDNIRFILVLLVVWGHLLEITAGYGSGSLIYRVIYSFHMPAFMFLTGYFAKYNRIKICNFLMIYIIFQILYNIYDFYYLNYDAEKSFRLQFTTPYWLLWYLFTMIICYLLIPFFDSNNKQIRYIVIAGTILISVLASLDTSVGYYLSLSRFFTFLPYFVMGYYKGHYSAGSEPSSCKNFKSILMMLAGAVATILILREMPQISAPVLYGSYSYEAASYNILTKLLLMVIAYIWIAILFNFPGLSNKIPFITAMGRNTFPIFILHGFIIRALGKNVCLSVASQWNVVIAFILAMVICVLLGNRIVANIFNKLFLSDWLKIIMRLRGNNELTK